MKGHLDISKPNRWCALPTGGVVVGLVLMQLALMPALVLATDDGGSRSVFARGAGNRALALGGAYAAVANDASAPIWNPGGLGLIERSSVYASHTNLIGMGFSEQFASLVLPSWRYGIFSLSFSHFGVDGIEQRDDRNVLLADDLSDSEMEVVLGYGRWFGSAWSVGGALKMQRQDIAGFEDSGFGLDFGLTVKPLLAFGSAADIADDFSLGLAIRNAIQPTLRLQEEGVPDPTGLRVGLALTRPVGPLGLLLLTTDVEKTQYMDANWHLGAEWRLVDPLALRLGSNEGNLAAGVELSWRDIAFDYVFEDNVIEAVHRVGLTIAFGSSTAQQRQAALDAQEQALQDRLIDAFEERNRSRIDRLASSARSALAAGRPDAALTQTATIAVLDPRWPDLDTIEAEAYRLKGDQAMSEQNYSAAVVNYGRCLASDPDAAAVRRSLALAQEASNERAARSAEIRQIYDEALAAYTSEEYLAARDGFAEVLRKDPGDSEAAAMLRHTEQTIEMRAAGLAEQARAYIEAGDLDRARDALARARALSSEGATIERVEELLAAAAQRATNELVAESQAASQKTAVTDSFEPTGAELAGLSAAAAAPATSIRLSPERQAEIDDLYRRGMDAAAAGRRDDAIRYWELVWSAAPDHQQVAEHLKREYLVGGMEAFAAGQLPRAVAEWEKALEIDPADERARGYLERAVTQQDRIRQIKDEAR